MINPCKRLMNWVTWEIIKKFLEFHFSQIANCKGKSTKGLVILIGKKTYIYVIACSRYTTIVLIIITYKDSNRLRSRIRDSEELH